MGHYAFLDQNNIVTEVIVGKDEFEDSVDWEQHYSQIKGQVCKRTSYNTWLGKHKNGGIPFRKNFAGIGFLYDNDLDAFIPPKPYTSWILNEESCDWYPPVPYPQDGKKYIWDENIINWLEI